MSTSGKMFPGWMFPDLNEVEARGGTLEDLLSPPEPPPLPDRLTHQVLRNAVTGVLAGAVKAYDLAEECVRFGLEPPAGEHDDPWNSKWNYVGRRVRHQAMPDLLDLAGKVIAVYDDRLLEHLLMLAAAGGVRGEMKNLIFAADGPKPKIVLRDALNNDLEITENAEHCLVYDRPLDEGGLTWRQLVAWWARDDELAEEQERDAGRELYKRLLRSAANNAERFIFERYCTRYGTSGFDVPALIPQVYVHYDPYSRQAGGTLTRQRMDFLLLLPRHRRAVIELDGIQHYADRDDRADPARYAEMACADRELRLAGYEVYRFGGHEIADKDKATVLLDMFFDRLLGNV